MTAASEVFLVHGDESSESCQRLIRTLRAAGIAVRAHVNGQAGLTLEKPSPDLIILSDGRRGEMASEICRKIKRDPETSRIPVLVVTAAEAGEEDADIGADGYLSSQAGPREVLATIRALLRVRRVEEKLLVAARERRATIEAISHEICLLDPDGRIRRCNRAMRERLRKPYREIAGKPCREVLCAESGCDPQCPFLRLRETQRRETGSAHWDGRRYDITAEPVLDPAGKLRGAVLVFADVTGQRLAEEARQASEARYRLLFDSNPLPLLVYDLDSLAILAANDAAIRQYGYSREEFLGIPLQQLYPPADLSESWADDQRRLPRAGLPETCRHRRKNGEFIYVEATRYPVQFGSRPAGFMLANDITEGKRAELFCRMLMDSIPSSVLLFDESLRVVLANRNFLEKSRRTRSETLGKRITEVFPEVILDEIRLAAQLQAVFADNRARLGQRLQYSVPGLPLRIYYYSIIPVSWDARVDHALLLMDDITEQTRMSEEIREMERRLASVVESASDIVLSTDTGGRILTWNKAAERISGYTREEVTGRCLFEYCEQGGSPQLRASFSSARGADSSGIECDLITRDGKRRHVSWVFSPMAGDRRRTAGVVAVGRDLTERRKFEMQLLRSQKMAALGVMAGGIAHEIRTPLTVSSSAAQFLMDEDITPEFRRECAEKVHLGIQRASVIIANLLGFAHPSVKVDRVPLDLIQVLREAMTLIANQARVQKVEVAAELPNAPLEVLGVAGLLEQVFMNLFLNAMTAMSGGGTLTVSARRTGGDVAVHVSDTGHGVLKEDISNIFDPFYTKARVGKGSGLGLSICYSIIERHMGSIDVESQEGKGSTFTVRLPLL